MITSIALPFLCRWVFFIFNNMTVPFSQKQQGKVREEKLEKCSMKFHIILFIQIGCLFVFGGMCMCGTYQETPLMAWRISMKIWKHSVLKTFTTVFTNDTYESLSGANDLPCNLNHTGESINAHITYKSQQAVAKLLVRVVSS